MIAVLMYSSMELSNEQGTKRGKNSVPVCPESTPGSDGKKNKMCIAFQFLTYSFWRHL